jgi:hypothetical protein
VAMRRRDAVRRGGRRSLRPAGLPFKLTARGLAARAWAISSRRAAANPPTVPIHGAADV